MAFTETLSDFFGDFQTVASFSGTTANVIFDEEYIETESITGVAPIMTCQTSEVSSLQEGDSVVVNGTTYYVIHKQPDGTGVSRVLLHK